MPTARGAMIYTTSQPGIDLIKRFEGCQLRTYCCPAGKPTIGFGHTGADVYDGLIITPERAEEMLRDDLRDVEKAVLQAVTAPITQGQFDALVSFTYNVGIGALKASTLLRKLNAEDYIGASAQFSLWTKAGGRDLPGLIRRRAAERSMFDAR